jgi:hypothetical protein
VRVTPAVTANFALTTGDCVYTLPSGISTFADDYSIYVPSGRKLRVTVDASASGFTPQIDFRDGNIDATPGVLFASASAAPGTTSVVLEHTFAADSWAKIWVSGNGRGGAYRVTIEPLLLPAIPVKPPCTVACSVTTPGS